MWGNDFLAVTASHSFCLQKKKREKKKTSSKLFLKKCAFQEKTHRTLDRKPQKAMCCSTARHLPVTPESLLPEDRESGLYASAPLTAESEALGLGGRPKMSASALAHAWASPGRSGAVDAEGMSATRSEVPLTAGGVPGSGTASDSYSGNPLMSSGSSLSYSILHKTMVSQAVHCPRRRHFTSISWLHFEG